MFRSDPLPEHVDAVVIGSGIFGAATAFNLAEAGLQVAVVERGEFCGEASGANAGLMVPFDRSPELMSSLARRSGEIYLSLAKRLGRDVGYNPTGVLRVALTNEELANTCQWVKRQVAAGIDARLVDADQARALEPTLPPSVLGGAASTTGGYIYPFSAVAAYLARAQELGVHLVGSTNATGITVRNGRVASVQTSHGTIRTQHVINAGGAWAGQISAMVDLHTPVVPVRGQILVTEPTTGLPTRVVRGLFPSLGRTWAGNGLIGAVRQDVGYNKQTTLAAMRMFARGIVEVYPHLKHVQIIRSWAGLRPRSADGLPILGESERVKGFVVAAGAFDIGMILGPAVGEVITDVVLGRSPAIDLSIAHPDRFSDTVNAPEHQPVA